MYAARSHASRTYLGSPHTSHAHAFVAILDEALWITSNDSIPELLPSAKGLDDVPFIAAAAGACRNQCTGREHNPADVPEHPSHCRVLVHRGHRPRSTARVPTRQFPIVQRLALSPAATISTLLEWG
jgi:hypothetical protein